MAKKTLAVVNRVFEKGAAHVLSLDYGNTYSDGSFHKGVDMYTGEESKVVAIEAGTVVNCANNVAGVVKDTGTLGMGNYVILEHANGTRSRYQHMKCGSVTVKKGSKVVKGQVIGVIGNTGNSAGRHLHFDISYPSRYTGGYYSSGRYYVDPKPYLLGTANLLASTSTATYTVTASALNVRASASASAAIVGKLYKGAKVVVTESKDGFGKIGANRWVSMNYLARC